MQEVQGVLKQEGYDFMAAAFEVYDELGPGFLGDAYQEALEVELALRGIVFEAKPKIPIRYEGRILRKHYEPDLVVFGGIAVELKAARTLAPEHEAQLINYLKASGLRVGYLLNFGAHPRLEWIRRIR